MARLRHLRHLRHRALLLGLTLLAACFGNPQTLGLPCTEDSACFDGLVCGPGGVCLDPSNADSLDSLDSLDSPDMGDGDGDTEDGESEDGESETGEGDGETGDGDGDAGDGDGDGDGETGDGDGDGETGEPVCGNGIREGGEVCDGTDLGGNTCANFGYGGGSITCSNCDLVLSECCLAEGQGCQLLDTSCCGSMQCALITFVCG